MAVSPGVLHARSHDLGIVLMCWQIVQAYCYLGFPASYGIFQEYYSTNDFKGSSNIAVVGACAMVTFSLRPT